jgi:hypothetical protein
MLKKYFWNVLIAFDQFCNAVLFGDPDETISSRLGKWLDLPKDTWRYTIADAICRVLRTIDKNHCRKSVEKDEGDRNIL